MLHMSHKAKERWLSGFLAVAVLVVIWLLLHRKGTNINNEVAPGLQVPVIPGIKINGSTVPGVSLAYRPGDVSFLFPDNHPHSACGCGCDPASGANSLIADNVAAFAAGMSKAEGEYYAETYAALPAYIKQFTATALGQ